MVAARGASPGWAAQTAYNRGQVLYRVAELMEGRRSQFATNSPTPVPPTRTAAVDAAIDRWVWYAGWADKIAPDRLGVEPRRRARTSTSRSPSRPAWWASSRRIDQSLLGLVSRLAPAIVGGNTTVVLASERSPLPAVSLAEVLATSDVPGGVVNILTGVTAELVPWLASHMDVNAIDVTGVPDELRADTERAAADNVKRVHRAPDADPFADEAQSPYEITALMEFKTVWHPMGA